MAVADTEQGMWAQRLSLTALTRIPFLLRTNASRYTASFTHRKFTSTLDTKPKCQSNYITSWHSKIKRQSTYRFVDKCHCYKYSFFNNCGADRIVDSISASTKIYIRSAKRLQGQNNKKIVNIFFPYK